MSETKKVLQPGSTRVNHTIPTDIGGALVSNHNPYPVEVTVRRVGERITFERRLAGNGPGGPFLVADFGALLTEAGYDGGRLVRVTIEPL